MNILEIKERLKHRYPFLMIDRVLKLEERVSCTALKNVTANEGYFSGHFPDRPVMPGVLILEALAQTGGIASYTFHEDSSDETTVVVGFDKVKFKKPVLPGDQLILRSTIIKLKMNICFFKGEAFVDDALVASAEFRLAVSPLR